MLTYPSSGIDTLVNQYRNGDSSAAEELLRAYALYLKKWLRLLTSGRWDRDDKEVIYFLSMVGCVDINTSAQVLYKKLRPYERDDLLQEVRVALLETALRSNNIVAQYRFVLWMRIKKLINETLVSQWGRSVELDEADFPTGLSVDLDDAWVEGITCSAGFSHLSSQERMILLCTKWYGMSIEKTAATLGLSPSKIDRVIRKSKSILREYYYSKPSTNLSIKYLEGGR